MAKDNRYRYRRGGRWPYNTDRWAKLRAEVIFEAGGACSECGTGRKRLDIHHINRLTSKQIKERDEKAAFESPLKVLCVSCHSMITSGVVKSERLRRSKWRAFINGESTHETV